MPYYLYAWYYSKGYDLVDKDPDLEPMQELAGKLDPYAVERYMIIDKSKHGDFPIEIEHLEKPKCLKKKLTK